MCVKTLKIIAFPSGYIIHEKGVKFACGDNICPTPTQAVKKKHSITIEKCTFSEPCQKENISQEIV